MSVPESKKTEQRPTAIVFNGLSFIGISLCEKLLNHQVEVICIDKFTKEQTQKAQALLSDPHFHRLKSSSHSDFFKRISRAHYIFHILLPHSIPKQNLNNLISHTAITKKLLTLAKKHSAKFALITQDYCSPLQPNTLNGKWGPPTQHKQHFSLQETIRVAHSLTSQYFVKERLDARAIHLLDVYGPSMDLSNPNPLSRLLYQAKNHLPLSLDNDGLDNIYPTYIFDAVRGIIQAMFTSATKGKVFDIFTPHPISQQKFVDRLKDQLPYRVDIDSNQKTNSITRNIDVNKARDSQELLKWKSKVSLSEGLGQTIQWLEHADINIVEFPPTLPKQTLKPLIKASIDLPQPKTIKSHKPLTPKRSKSLKTTKIQKTIIATIALLILTAISPFISFIITTTNGFTKLNKAQNELKVYAIENSQKHSKGSISSFQKSFNSLKYINALLSPLGAEGFVSYLESIIQIGESLAQTGLHLTSAASSALESTKAVFGQSQDDISQGLINSQAEITKAYEAASQAQAQLQGNQRLTSTNNKVGESFNKLSSELPPLITGIQKARALLQHLPQIIGANGSKKVYLVLLQNNAELRPTGGFIGSFALITFENGRLLDFIVEDVYAADGQLKGHVEPPRPIKQYLGEATWYLRDVNWNPDFPTTARQAEWFLQKQLNQTVDGTIAVNLYVAQEILKSLESLHLSDYNEDITASNLFSRAQYHSEVDFFPGSTQKKNFLSSLAQALYLKLQQLDVNQTIKLSQALNQSLDSNQLALSFVDQKLATAFADLNWDGKLLYTSDCTHTACLKDFLLVNDANLGVNKANFFVKRRIDYNLNIQKDGSSLATATIDYNNTSPAESWPAGTYKNYLRLFVPRRSKLKSVKINDKKVDLDTIDIEHLDYHTSIGFLVSVPIKSKSQVKVSYELPQKLEFERSDPQTQYKLLIQKQPGTGPDPINITINYPAYLKPLDITPTDIISSPQAATLSNTFSQNQDFSITFKK